MNLFLAHFIKYTGVRGSDSNPLYEPILSRLLNPLAIPENSSLHELSSQDISQGVDFKRELVNINMPDLDYFEFIPALVVKHIHLFLTNKLSGGLHNVASANEQLKEGDQEVYYSTEDLLAHMSRKIARDFSGGKPVEDMIPEIDDMLRTHMPSFLDPDANPLRSVDDEGLEQFFNGPTFPVEYTLPVANSHSGPFVHSTDPVVLQEAYDKLTIRYLIAYLYVDRFYDLLTSYKTDYSSWDMSDSGTKVSIVLPCGPDSDSDFELDLRIESPSSDEDDNLDFKDELEYLIFEDSKILKIVLKAIAKPDLWLAYRSADQSGSRKNFLSKLRDELKDQPSLVALLFNLAFRLVGAGSEEELEDVFRIVEAIMNEIERRIESDDYADFKPFPRNDRLQVAFDHGFRVVKMSEDIASYEPIQDGYTSLGSLLPGCYIISGESQGRKSTFASVLNKMIIHPEKPDDDVESDIHSRPIFRSLSSNDVQIIDVGEPSRDGKRFSLFRTDRVAKSLADRIQQYVETDEDDDKMPIIVVDSWKSGYMRSTLSDANAMTGGITAPYMEALTVLTNVASFTGTILTLVVNPLVQVQAQQKAAFESVHKGMAFGIFLPDIDAASFSIRSYSKRNTVSMDQTFRELLDGSQTPAEKFAPLRNRNDIL